MATKYDLYRAYAREHGVGAEYDFLVEMRGKTRRSWIESEIGPIDRLLDLPIATRSVSHGEVCVEIPTTVVIEPEEIERWVQMTLIDSQKEIGTRQCRDLTKTVVCHVAGSDPYDLDLELGSLRPDFVEPNSRRPVWDQIIEGYRSYTENPDLADWLFRVYLETDASPTGQQQRQAIESLYRDEEISSEQRARLRENGVLDLMRRND